MDFGFGSLIEKFEEHIGKRATRVLLTLSAVALLVVILNTIITMGILPVWKAVQGASSQPFLAVLKTVGVGSLLAIVAALVLAVVLRLLLRRLIERANEYVQRASDHVARAEKFAEDIYQRIEADTESVWLLISEAEALVKETKGLQARNEAMQAEIESHLTKEP